MLAKAYGWKGMAVQDPRELDDAIEEMIAHPGPVLMDCRVANLTNCFPMIPSGKAHNEILLASSDDVEAEEVESALEDAGRALV